ncbi:class I mannose-6-phosphate isomerase [Sphingobium phenoxybenzoativorans]|uniref:Class I mannose-6-phosphate isomerase n=1 Tax=Sphingobium phenoxybenzoativorans TaxID=1592790 RepID=A0A975Q0H6_9SPHN|nr:class I mannose-6-phosphate isomerase [Sphingobium phenoxybenzoativorans]QUT04332.1 class I mannose-6-phosphate isomerase [Sphingobium phenoxybenzoativorans]
MSAVKLHTKSVEKPWGRTDLPSIFPNPEKKQIGEIWFDGPEGRHPPLLIKYIFTSEKLSIQVHPNDAEAKERGLPGGKSECWYILDAEPGAVLGIGLKRPLHAEELRAAAIDGSIEGLIDWKPVSKGSFYYIPAGTVHAIGGGLTLVEAQINNDVTYRLYDYGRPRELHLDNGVAVSKAVPHPMQEQVIPLGSATRMLEGTDKPFALDMASWPAKETITLGNGQSWFIPLTGDGTIDGKVWREGECWLVDGGAQISVTSDTQALVATL